MFLGLKSFMAYMPSYQSNTNFIVLETETKSAYDQQRIVKKCFDQSKYSWDNNSYLQPQTAL